MNNNPAIIWGARRISFGQMEQYASGAASQLKGLGIKPGDRVAICAPSCVEYIIVLFGLWRTGAVACPISPRWPLRAVSDFLSRVNAALLLTTVAIKSHWPGLPTRSLYLNEIVCFDARRDFSARGFFHPDINQEVTVIATSGSSGLPKAAVHTWGNHYYSALGAQEMVPLDSGDRWFLLLPLYHVAGIAIVMRAFLAGAAIIIGMENDLEETMIKRRPTHVSLVATQMRRLLQTPAGTAALQSLKYILLGGSAVPATLIEQSLTHGLNVYLSYGLTEMSSQVATGKAGGRVKALPDRQLKISDEGEILVKGKTLFKGYIQPGRIHLPLTDDGWFQTGDLGRLDDQGCLSVLGRRDNMFISGGENIQPEEIERVLLSLEGVVEAVVVPKQDAEFGHRPVAFIKFDAGNGRDRSLPKDQIIKYCEQSLPRFKIPVDFYPWPDDLIEKGLKISRKEIRGHVPNSENKGTCT
ncbi:MAG: o-succinylbenzoate--CoA ligase [Candidatus Omnitrophica bacterium]|nr:o-succinylbenzoate--CoA ligase [Candidatus Omnitrophota bacterium]